MGGRTTTPSESCLYPLSARPRSVDGSPAAKSESEMFTSSFEIDANKQSPLEPGVGRTRTPRTVGAH